MTIARQVFYTLSLTGSALGLYGYLSQSAWVYVWWPTALYIGVGLYDLNSTHNILRNYPIIGHLRYLFEAIRPEIQQYFVESNTNGRPYSRQQRNLVYRRSKNIEAMHPFGTENSITEPGYHYAAHSVKVQKVGAEKSRVWVGNDRCKQKYLASVLNISAMSYGSLSKNAVKALAMGACRGQFSMNTGEGGITEYHLQTGCDLVWQIGTGYFGCRGNDGRFDHALFEEKSQFSQVKMIEIKVSQGAKPSHGGVLPAQKITPEISRIRGIPMGRDCLSPPTHSVFSTPRGLLDFVQRLRDLSGDKPVGFKICIGQHVEFMAICKAMLASNIYPDFITVDGAEGGTGAAPLVFSNRLGVPANEALAFVHNCLVGCGIRDSIRLISSAKVVSSFDMVKRMALGADLLNVARPFLFSVGCIQALNCHSNLCPTGVTSTDPARYGALDVEDKHIHVCNFHENTVHAFLELVGAMGFSDPKDIHSDVIRMRVGDMQSKSFSDMYHFVEPGSFLSAHVPAYYNNAWQLATADTF